ncbi:MAG: endonuclease MutS2, partial [Nitrospinota bacterium]
MRRLLSEGPVSLGAFTDVRAWLPILKEGSEPLEPERILAVAGLIEQAHAAKRRLAEAASACPRLVSDIPDLSHLPPLASQIRRSIDPDGRLSDTASRRLQGIRRNLRSLRQEIRSMLESRMSEWSPALQEPLVLIRRDRYVIPVKPGFRRFLKGIILDQSASGQTLYVEPLLVQSENDRLAELRVDEIAESYRILRELTDWIHRERRSLSSLVAWLVEFDVLLSMARFADEYGCVEPQMGESPAFRLLRARHPLLEQQKGRRGVVPLDLQLDGGKRQLVITGANTGGKTVALKTAGLLTLAAHVGCPVPAAEGTEIPYRDQVFAEIGDDQSLAQNLSTFSARLAHQVSFLDRATDRSLVLMDELGAGTDPTEGSALGVAVLEALASKDATVVVTTHHEALKAYADEAPAALNAAVEFDREELSPTYRLLSGVAGTSYALAVAERLGMPREVVERAREMAQGGDPEGRAWANRLEEQTERLQALEKELRRERESAESERAELADERQKLAEQRDRFRVRADRFLREARLEVRKLEREARLAGRAAREVLPEMKTRARSGVSALEQSRIEVLAETP